MPIIEELPDDAVVGKVVDAPPATAPAAPPAAAPAAPPAAALAQADTINYRDWNPSVCDAELGAGVSDPMVVAQAAMAASKAKKDVQGKFDNLNSLLASASLTSDERKELQAKLTAMERV